MIASLKLVLDNNGAPVFVFRDQVDTEGTRRLLPFDSAELKARGVGQDIDVLLQPRREVEGFVAPNLTQSNALNASDPLVPTRGLGFPFAHAFILWLAVVRRRGWS